MKHNILRLLYTGAVSLALLVTQYMPLQAQETTPDKAVIATAYSYSRFDKNTQAGNTVQPTVTLTKEENDDLDAYAAVLRQALVNREASLTLDVPSSLVFHELTELLWNKALAYTGRGNEGDYLFFLCTGYNCSGKISYGDNGIAYHLSYTFTYITTKEQEETVTARLNEVYASLQLKGKSNYEKVKAIYDYIVSHVTYDYENANNREYLLKGTAYAALINGTCVCEGYSMLLYRMLLDQGIPVRMITGMTHVGLHAWNIIQLGSMYFNADATWENGTDHYKYFLLGSSNFTEHVADQAFLDSSFTSTHPIASYDYVPGRYVTGVTIYPSSLNLTPGSSYTLKVNLLPEDAENKSVSWTSSNPSIAEVDDYGNVKAKANGTAVITVTTADGGKTATCSIKVAPDPAACTVFGMCEYNGHRYWYEDGTRQGVIGDVKNIWDTTYGVERGREIYDPVSNGWYWLDACYDGAVATNKEVWMPYIYQKDLETGANPEGKWVRYDENGKMIKGWCSITGDQMLSLYPAQAGNTYYYNLITGEMVKGRKYIDGKWYHFDELTGVLTD